MILTAAIAIEDVPTGARVVETLEGANPRIVSHFGTGSHDVRVYFRDGGNQLYVRGGKVRVVLEAG